MPEIESEAKTADAFLVVSSKNKLASRKFLVTVGLFTGSLLVVFIKPELLGDGNIQVLFTFWTMLAAVFFGGNIGEHIVNGKKK